MLRLTRLWFTANSTIGSLALDGVVLHPDGFWVLEPPRRDDKLQCIPTGIYTVDLGPSLRFAHKPWYQHYNAVPHVQDVPGFEGILFHPGNDARDTLGCLLVGLKRDVDRVLWSVLAYEWMMEHVRWPQQLMVEERLSLNS